MTPSQKQRLPAIARQSIEHGILHGRALRVDEPAFQQPGASFVTLNLDGALRGCIGSLQAYRPLVQDVAENAFNAAFRDPRFPPVTRHELPILEIHLSILSSTEPMIFNSEQDLLRQLRPGIDGLVLQEGRYRGTFLPQVWESLPEPALFLTQLKRKAGLPDHYWSESLIVERYTVESIP